MYFQKLHNILPNLPRPVDLSHRQMMQVIDYSSKSGKDIYESIEDCINKRLITV